MKPFNDSGIALNHIFQALFRRGRCFEGTLVRRCVSPLQALGSEDQMGDVQLEREGLRRVLKQTGRIKCPKEVCLLQLGTDVSSMSGLDMESTLIQHVFFLSLFSPTSFSCYLLQLYSIFFSIHAELPSISLYLIRSLSFSLLSSVFLVILPKHTSPLCYQFLTLRCREGKRQGCGDRDIYNNLSSSMDMFNLSSTSVSFLCQTTTKNGWPSLLRNICLC